MMVKMRREDFDSLEDVALVRGIFEPIIPKIRGKSITVKQEIYQQLTREQQALFMFNAYYNHASNSLAEFYWWSAYYWAQPKTWSALKAGLRFFKADTLIQLLDDMEKIFISRKDQRSLEEFKVTYQDLDHNAELLASVSSLNTILHEISPAILKKIGMYIRTYPHEFIELEE